MKTQKTAHGFRLIEFTDLYRKSCSIQESSLAPHLALWLGVDEDGGGGGRRMHLGQEQARWLAGLLLTFAETGELPGDYEEPTP